MLILPTDSARRIIKCCSMLLLYLSHSAGSQPVLIEAGLPTVSECFCWITASLLSLQNSCLLPAFSLMSCIRWTSVTLLQNVVPVLSNQIIQQWPLLKHQWKNILESEVRTIPKMIIRKILHEIWPEGLLFSWFLQERHKVTLPEVVCTVIVLIWL
jgi:hypothetical protein